MISRVLYKFQFFRSAILSTAASSTVLQEDDLYQIYLAALNI